MKLFKKITYHFGGCCWRVDPYEQYYDRAVFKENSIRYVRGPEKSCRTNCYVEFRYKPSMDKWGENEYFLDYVSLCRAVYSLIEKTTYLKINDAIQSSLEIVFDDGAIMNMPLCVEGENFSLGVINKMVKKYAPDYFNEDRQ